VSPDQVNNEWDAESNSQPLNERVFNQEDIARATINPGSGAVSGWATADWSNNNGYGTWVTYSTVTGRPADTVQYSTMFVDEAASFTPTNSFTYHSSSWKETLAASFFLIKYALQLIWCKYVKKDLGGVELRWQR
jgi:hypothetical protein